MIERSLGPGINSRRLHIGEILYFFFSSRKFRVYIIDRRKDEEDRMNKVLET